VKSYRVAVIPGDGIGKEVVPEGMRVLQAAGRKFGIEFHWARRGGAGNRESDRDGARRGPRTRDIGETAGADQVGKAIAAAI
jgi:isocitrate/isopropylmalate dehydrogenase